MGVSVCVCLCVGVYAWVCLCVCESMYTRKQLLLYYKYVVNLLLHVKCNLLTLMYDRAIHKSMQTFQTINHCVTIGCFILVNYNI